MGTRLASLLARDEKCGRREPLLVNHEPSRTILRRTTAPCNGTGASCITGVSDAVRMRVHGAVRPECANSVS